MIYKNLLSNKKEEYFLFKKNCNKEKILLKSILILLNFLFISNIYIAYFIIDLRKKVSIINMYYDSNTINNIVQKYIQAQNDFCNYPSKFYHKQFEELIKLANFSFRNISYQMYVYKNSDNYMSKEIIETANYEPMYMSNFLEVLQYYGEKNKIVNNEDIFMLDIGGNLGAYPSFLEKFGYSFLTFEASPRNSYIINKNYCLINNNSNIIIIKEGLSNEEKICNYYSQIDGIGNGIVLCNENREKIKALIYKFNKTFEVKLTKLSNFLPYLLNKKIALTLFFFYNKGCLIIIIII